MSAEPIQTVSAKPDSNESASQGVNVPIWLMVLMVLLFYWGAVYFDQTGAWFSPHVYAPYHSFEEVKNFQFGGGASDVFEQGKAIYSRTCFACHQATGLGAPGQYPPLAGSDWLNEPQPGRILRLVLQGLQGPIVVKGQSFNNTMVPWNILTDQDIAAVLTYVRQNKEWGNNAPAVTAAQVKAVRDKIQKNHPGAFTPDELTKIPTSE